MPKVNHKSLLLFTGFIWLIASIILIRRAYSWISIMTDNQLFIGLIIAVILSIIKIYFIFQKLTLKNILRIQSFDQTLVSLWEFHILKDKILILLMIVLGAILRHTPFIPKYTLFPIYLGIGIAMFYVWMLYFRTIFKMKK